MRLPHLHTPLSETTHVRATFERGRLSGEHWKREIAGHPLQAFSQRLYDDGLKAIAAASPLTPEDFPSQQRVTVFRPVMMSDTLHPDAREFFDADELAAVTDDAAPRSLWSPANYRHFDYCGEKGDHAGLVAFQTECQERGAIEHEEKVKKRRERNLRRAVRAGHKVEAPASDVSPTEVLLAKLRSERFAADARSVKALVRDLYQNGFHHRGGEIAGEQVVAFSEYFGTNILRSHLGSPSLQQFVRILPRRGRLRIGHDKEAVYVERESKALGLLAPYIELDMKRLGAIVVELDTVWESTAALRRALLAILPPWLMPNLVVGRYDLDGRLCRPHLIWILDKDSSVWNDPRRKIFDADGGEIEVGDARCRTRPIKFYRAIHRALTSLLVPLGADPAHTNPFKPKNPISPFWSVAIFNDENWPKLTDFFEIPGFTLDVDEGAMHKRASDMRAKAAGAADTLSNLIWRVTGNVILPLVASALRDREPEFMSLCRAATPHALASWIECEVRPLVAAETGPSDALDRILERRCMFAANWARKKARAKPSSNRGLYAEALAGIDDPAERASITRRLQARRRHIKSFYRLKKDCYVATMGGRAVTRADFMKAHRAETSQAFAYRFLDEAMKAIGCEFSDGAYRYIVQHRPSLNVPLSPLSCPSTVADGAGPVVRSPAYPVVEPESPGPPVPDWLSPAPSSAEPRPVVDEACLESA